MNVPVVLPGYQWLVAAYPWLAPYYSISDSLGYTATPVFQLLDSAGNVLASSIPGDPYLDYTFTRADTYTVRVGAYVQWNATTTYLGVANTFHPPTETTGVTNGISYTLDISVQRHATNQNAVTLDGKTITIVSGPGAGQTATITHYDPQTSTYTLDRKWATAPGPGSKFEISQSTSSLPGYQPVTDSYQVVLTSQPTATVYVAVSPQPTPTYNAAQAFDPAANYGQNNQVQVRVKTPRALFLLTGTPAAGETWTILLDDRAFSYRLTGSGGLSLAAIAQTLAGVINDAGAGYTATIDPNNADQLVVESAAAFYAGFRVSHDLAGGATVTPAPAAGAEIAFSGTPAAGELWTLTLDGTAYWTTATAGESLAAIVARIVSRLPATYTTNVAGTVLTVSRDATQTPLTASVSVGAPTVGTITAALDFSAGYGTKLTFAGQPVDGETWQVGIYNALDGSTVTAAVTSTAGESLASVVSAIAAQIPAYDYAVSVGLDALTVSYSNWVYRYYYGAPSASTSVALDPTTTYGSGAVTPTHPSGVTVTLDLPAGQSPSTGESWTLTLDGNRYATEVTAGETLGQIASALAAQVPTTPAAANGGPVYAVVLSGAAMTFRRVDASVAVTASVSVAAPGSASTSTSGNTATVTFKGSALAGQVWALTVDGTQYAVVSQTGESLTRSPPRSKRWCPRRATRRRRAAARSRSRARSGRRSTRTARSSSTPRRRRRPARRPRPARPRRSPSPAPSAAARRGRSPSTAPTTRRPPTPRTRPRRSPPASALSSRAARTT